MSCLPTDCVYCLFKKKTAVQKGYMYFCSLVTSVSIDLEASSCWTVSNTPFMLYTIDVRVIAIFNLKKAIRYEYDQNCNCIIPNLRLLQSRTYFQYEINSAISEARILFIFYTFPNMISNFTFPTIIGTKIPDYSEGSLLQMQYPELIWTKVDIQVRSKPFQK
jgi:hypothetical protein